MARIKTTRKMSFGSKAKYTNWGSRGCSRGMYSTGGFDYYVYGIKGLFAFEIMKRWGDLIV